MFEDGKPQKIAVFHRESELPLSIVVAIDTSLSTRSDQKLELESARRFAHAILRPIDGLSLFQFSEIVDQLTPFTADVRVIDHAINRVHSGAATALYDTLYLGSDALLDRRGRKVMVVITDGGDTVSKTSYQEAVREAQQAEVILYSIIIVPIENSAGRDIGGEHALIQLSRDTGGKYFYASGLEQLDAAFRQISDELRTQYLIAYYPSDATGRLRLSPHRDQGRSHDQGLSQSCRACRCAIAPATTPCPRSSGWQSPGMGVPVADKGRQVVTLPAGSYESTVTQPVPS